ncbi:MAG: hydrogenase maturation protease [Candidatus Zixiibacteriota bacterium]|nr:MAG: hydrogenase maturation protease [candidate division Zixibacteria bacterium]
MNRKIVVLGVGSVIRRDDGLGVRAMEMLQDHPRLSSGAAIHEAGTMGLGALDYAAEATHLLILDAADVGAEPGTLVRLSGEEISLLRGGKSAHDLGVVDLIAAMRLLGREPEQILLLGLQPLETGFGTELTLTVAANLGSLVEAALAQVEAWITSKSTAIPPATQPKRTGLRV